MITYLDMTFCKTEECTDRHTCARWLSNKVRDRACEVGLPISMSCWWDGVTTTCVLRWNCSDVSARRVK